MNFNFRVANKENLKEMKFIGEKDARIPLEYDSHFIFTEASIDSRLDFYKQLSDNDFFEVVTSDESIIAFHIVKKSPYPPNFQMATIISLWVDPQYRRLGLAAKLKSRAEKWAKDEGISFIQTGVHKNNARMLLINESNGYELTYYTLRKYL
ncbi:MAG: GNAT family N-acetyltransferase [Bacteriovoracaceae bacterium]